MITLKEKFDKKDITLLPKESFKGRIFVIISEKESDKAVKYLLNQKIIGIDTETRPSFRRGQHYKVALLQVSTHDTCFLFRLNRIGITSSLKKLLEDCKVIKVGLSLKGDLRLLSKREDFTRGLFIDILNEIKDIGIQDLSLQKIYANIFGMKIAKNQQLTNWEADALTEAQQLYAATDAWACIRIHEELKRLKETGDYTIIKTD